MTKRATGKNRPSPPEVAPPEPAFQLGEAAQAAQERFNEHIRMLLERLGCGEPTEPSE